MAGIPYQNIRSILADQLRRFQTLFPGVKRRVDLNKYRDHPQIVVISGVRRCGKSTLLRQFTELFTSYLYLNLDDERFAGITIRDLTEIAKIFEEISPGVRTIFIDEIQNVPEWERFIRRIHDDGYQIFLTGSNAALLSTELGTRLTGRYVKISLWPFGFDEFCLFNGVSECPIGTEREAEIQRLFSRFLEEGGFPGYLRFADSEMLHQIYEDILYRDIIVRYGIREILPFRELTRYLYTNITREASYHSLARSIGMKNAMTMRAWIGYLQDSYLISECYQFDYSLRRQHAYSRKYYGVDSGLRNAIAFRFSEDTGVLLEQVVWLELKRRREEIYWFKGTGECDFIVFDRGRVTMCIQVCAEVTRENRTREISGLLEAMNRCECERGIILTMWQTEMTEESGIPIQVLPVWDWVLSEIPSFRRILVI
jgi:uncharacterized protein